MEPYELGQETKVASYRSHQIQWPALQQIKLFVASTTPII